MKQQHEFLDRELEVYQKIAPALSLLDDPDTDISQHISEFLASFGSSIVPFVRREMKEHSSEQAIVTLQSVLRKLQEEGLNEVKEYVLSCRSRQISPDMFTLLICFHILVILNQMHGSLKRNSIRWPKQSRNISN